MICENIDMLKKALDGVLAAGERDVRIVDEKRLRDTLIDDLIRTAVFAPDEGTRAAARWVIRRTGGGGGHFRFVDPGALRGDGPRGGLRVHGAGDQHPRAHLRHRPGGLPGGAGRRGRGDDLRDRPLGDRLHPPAAGGVHLRRDRGGHQDRIPGAALHPGRPLPGGGEEIREGPGGRGQGRQGPDLGGDRCGLLQHRHRHLDPGRPVRADGGASSSGSTTPWLPSSRR